MSKLKSTRLSLIMPLLSSCIMFRALTLSFKLVFLLWLLSLFLLLVFYFHFFFILYFLFYLFIYFFIYFFNFYLLGYDLGNEIANLLDTDRVSMYSNNTQYPLSTSNIIADIKKGDASNTIGNYYYFLIIYLISFYFYFYFILIHLYFYLVSGSHLDSVLAGPGINDNGSGSSGNLGKQK